jgi:hypothetical protein
LAGAAIVVEKGSVALSWRQIPVSAGIEIAIKILGELVVLKVVVTEMGVQGSGASIEPVIVCRPFLKASCRATEGMCGVLAGEGTVGVAISCVCGTERAKPTSVIRRIIVATTHRRVCFMTV